MGYTLSVIGGGKPPIKRSGGKKMKKKLLITRNQIGKLFELVGNGQANEMFRVEIEELSSGNSGVVGTPEIWK